MKYTLYKTITADNENGETVLLWKFRDENGNLWNTETPIDGTEEDAIAIIMQSISSE